MKYLSEITGDPIYWKKAEKVIISSCSFFEVGVVFLGAEQTRLFAFVAGHGRDSSSTFDGWSSSYFPEVAFSSQAQNIARLTRASSS